MEEQVLAAGLGGGAVDVPHHPRQRVAGTLGRRQRLVVAGHVDAVAPGLSRTAVPASTSDRPGVRSAPRRPQSGQRSPSDHARPGAPLVVAAQREAVRQRAQARCAVHPAVRPATARWVRPRFPPRAPAADAADRRLGGPAGPVLHRPAAGDQRRADLGVALDVEAGEGERVRRGRRRVPLPSTPSPVGPARRAGRPTSSRRSVDSADRAAVVHTPVEPPVPEVPDRVAPAAGLAVRISGTTQAAAPAVATADMRPMAWRRDIRGRPDGASPSRATGRRRTSLRACLAVHVVTVLARLPSVPWITPGPRVSYRPWAANCAIAVVTRPTGDPAACEGPRRRSPCT